MTQPCLLIFDIDATLIVPDYFYTHDQVKKGLYDTELLTPYLTDPDFQIALASFNQDHPGVACLAGRRLGRAILDVQHPTGHSKGSVDDIFIQAWRGSPREMIANGKNVHIKIIIEAYLGKYGYYPPVIIFYDDDIHNVYLAAKTSVNAFWVQDGLCRCNVQRCPPIGYRVKFTTDKGDIMDCVGDIEKGELFINQESKEHTFYLPPKQECADKLWRGLQGVLEKCNVTVDIISSDLGEQVP